MAFLLILVLKKAPEHETVVIFARSKYLKRPRSTRLLAFLLIQVLKKAPEHDTVSIFRNLDAQNGPRTKYSCSFCNFRCSKRAWKNQILTGLLEIAFSIHKKWFSEPFFGPVGGEPKLMIQQDLEHDSERLRSMILLSF